MRRFVVINSKGGCGKTTIACNLASYYAAAGYNTVLFDHDPQVSTMRWLDLRSETSPAIKGIAAAKGHASNVTRSFHLRIPPDTERVILDTPASLQRMEIMDLLRGAHAIIVPVLPSAIDAYVSINFVRELLRLARSCAPGVPIGIVANRVRINTLAFRRLRKEVEALGVPMVSWLRDTQNYVFASEMGMGIHELSGQRVRKDHEQWEPLIDWLEDPDRQTLPPILKGKDGYYVAPT
ncbi:MAG TPA: ParA family protein [Chromatiales bacterium]|nr:ParA family protein [Chromatiales bacterium]